MVAQRWEEGIAKATETGKIKISKRQETQRSESIICQPLSLYGHFIFLGHDVKNKSPGRSKGESTFANLMEFSYQKLKVITAMEANR